MRQCTHAQNKGVTMNFFRLSRFTFHVSRCLFILFIVAILLIPHASAKYRRNPRHEPQTGYPRSPEPPQQRPNHPARDVKT